MVQAMRHGVLPQTLHVDEPSPHVDWSAGSVELLTEARSWPETGRPRRAGVSSFGVSGTNAHVIIEQVGAENASGEGVPQDLDAVNGQAVNGQGVRRHGAVHAGRPGSVPWLLSARSADALRGQADRLLSFVEGDAGLDPVDVGYSLVASRAVLEHRAVVVAGDREGLLAGVGAVASGESAAHVVTGRADSDGKAVFVFSGQGSQWVGMGVELLDSSPVFAERMRECERALAPFVEWSLVEVLGDEVALARVDVVQPALFAVMVSLAELWRSFGVEPAAVVGHSQGEIAAACVAGALSLEDAARVVVLGSQALGDYAAHSAHMEDIHERLLEKLAVISPHTSEVPFFSTVTQDWLDTATMDAEYWYRNLWQSGEFEQSTRELLRHGHEAFIEISPHPILNLALRDTIDNAEGEAVVVGSLRRNDGGLDRFLISVGEAHVQGVSVAWKAAFAGSDARRVELPTYAFQRQRYWLDTPAPAGDTTEPAVGADPVDARFWQAVEHSDLDALASMLTVDDDQRNSALNALLPALPVLSTMPVLRRQHRDQSIVDCWRYGVSWHPLTEPRTPVLSGTWLVLVPVNTVDGVDNQGHRRRSRQSSYRD